MKHLISSLFLTACLLTSALADAAQPQLVELGIPTAQWYKNAKQRVSRNAWDMAIHDGILYVGCGDYSANTGPVMIYGCDLETGEWKRTGMMSDEALLRFVRLDGTLVVPGTDPTTDWSNGYYYTLTEGKWKNTRVPNAVHMYDIADYDDARIVGIGTSGDYVYPALISRDGKTWKNVPFYDANGEEYFGKNEYDRCRVYDFFHLNGELYALLNAHDTKLTYTKLAGIFHYENGGFHLWSNPRLAHTRGSRQARVYEDVEMDGWCYMAFDKLYRTADFKTVTTVALPDDGLVQDLLLDTAEDGTQTLYVLGTRRDEKNIADWHTTIWKSTDGTSFEAVYTFTYNTSAMSFVKDGDDFYVGMGRYSRSGTVGDSNLGMILHIDY